MECERVSTITKKLIPISNQEIDTGIAISRREMQMLVTDQTWNCETVEQSHFENLVIKTLGIYKKQVHSVDGVSVVE